MVLMITLKMGVSPPVVVAVAVFVFVFVFIFVVVVVVVVVVCCCFLIYIIVESPWARPVGVTIGNSVSESQLSR